VKHAAPSFVSSLLVVCLAFFAPIISHSVKKMAVPLVVVEILGGYNIRQKRFQPNKAIRNPMYWRYL